MNNKTDIFNDRELYREVFTNILKSLQHLKIALELPSCISNESSVGFWMDQTRFLLQTYRKSYGSFYSQENQIVSYYLNRLKKHELQYVGLQIYMNRLIKLLNKMLYIF